MFPDISTIISEEMPGMFSGGIAAESTVDNEVLNIKTLRYGTAKLGLPNRSYNALSREGIQTVKDLTDIQRGGRLYELYGVGEVLYTEIVDALWLCSAGELRQLNRLYTSSLADRINNYGGADIPDEATVRSTDWKDPKGRFPEWDQLYGSLSSSEWSSLLGALAMVTPGRSLLGNGIYKIMDIRRAKSGLKIGSVLDIRNSRLKFLQRALVR